MVEGFGWTSCERDSFVCGGGERVRGLVVCWVQCLFGWPTEGCCISRCRHVCESAQGRSFVHEDRCFQEVVLKAAWIAYGH